MQRGNLRIPSFFVPGFEESEKNGIFETATSFKSGCVMKIPVCLSGLLVLFLAACSKDDAQQPVDPPVPAYEYVSVKYESLRTEPIEEVVARTTFANNIDQECGATCSSEEPADFSSLFESDLFPKGDFSECDVPLPRVDMDGRFVGLASQAVPLSVNEWYEWTVPASFSQSYKIPANTTVRERILECGFVVTADFQLAVRNPIDGKTVLVNGTWSGQQITHRIVRVEYENADPLEWEHRVNWP